MTSRRQFVTCRNVLPLPRLVKLRPQAQGAGRPQSPLRLTGRMRRNRLRRNPCSAQLGLWHTAAMRQAHFESAEVRDYIGARGGVLCISLQAIMHG